MSDFDEFISVIHSIRDKDTLEDFLLGITTPKERHELSKRIDIVRQLLRGTPHQMIASTLHVGVATVTRGSKELSQGKFRALKK